MPTQTYRVTEPHPSLPQTTYMHSGRGGAGNTKHIDPTSCSTSTGVTSSSFTNSSASRTPAITSSYYATGRGGLGNMHAAYLSERPIFSFDEELERQARMQASMAPVYHIGRGGAGNLVASTDGAGMARRTASSLGEGSSSSKASSSAGPSSGAMRTSLEGTWSRLRESIAK